MMRRRRLSVAALVVCAACGALSGAARAAPNQMSMFMDDDLLLYSGDSRADATIDELHDLGVTEIRVSVPWFAFAPGAHSPKRPKSFAKASSPASYEAAVFDHTDHLLRKATSAGIRVLLNITGGAPLWATGVSGGRHVNLEYKPSPAAFGNFVAMLGTRYDGHHTDENQGQASLPRVYDWSIWNEPNSGAQLQPQWERIAGALRPVAGRYYRGLFRAASAALRRTGHGADNILLGETAPRGASRKGRTRGLRPIRFLASLLCMNERTLRPLFGAAARAQGCDYAHAGRLRATGYAHHPYSIVSPPATADPNPLDVTLADEARLARFLDTAARLKHVSAGLPFWWTEYGWQTPPDPVRGVDPGLQAKWLAEAEKITRADGRAAGLLQFLLRDDEPRDSSNAQVRWGTYQTGLELADGTRKPAYDAYRLPLVAPAGARAGNAVTLWGLVRPARGAATSVRLQFAAGSSDDFQNVGDVQVGGPGSSFTTTVTPPGAGRYRFQWTGPAPPPQPGGLLGQQPTQGPAPVYNSVAVTIAG